MAKLTFAVLLLVGIVGYSQIEAHMRLLEPPSRASLWKFPEYSQFKPEVDVQDNECFCGGFAHQWQELGGKCGVCGDPYDEPEPRRHEGGGVYGKGIIARTYTAGQTIPVQIHLTADHKGWFEFKLCPQNNPLVPTTQECLDLYPLQLADGSGSRYYPTRGSVVYDYEVKLPEGVTCEFSCTLQLHYNTGNSWGVDPKTGESGIGFGPQENFRHCADIRILP